MWYVIFKETAALRIYYGLRYIAFDTFNEASDYVSTHGISECIISDYLIRV